MNKELKTTIEHNLQEMNLEKVAAILSDYENKYSDDRDLLSYQTLFYFYNGEYEKAYEYAELGIRRFPTSEEMYYNIAVVCEEKNEVINAFKYYKIALFLIVFKHKQNEQENEELLEDINIRIKGLEEKLEQLTEYYIQEKMGEELLKIQSCVFRAKSSWFGKYEKNARDFLNKIVGSEYWIEDDDRRFIGLYRAPNPLLVGVDNLDLIHTQGEFINTTSGFQYHVTGEAEEYLLPIASSEGENLHTFVQEGKEYRISQRFGKHFNYYRVKNGTSVSSEKECFYGNPIPLRHNPKRKNWF